MNVSRSLSILILAGLLLSLAGCGLDPVQPDQEIALQPGQGIAAVVIDTLDPLNAFYIKSGDHDSAPVIKIPHVEVGVHLFIFVVPSGSYCVTRFSSGSYYFTADDPKHGACFDVIAGKVAYSGNLSPRGYNGRVITDQDYNWPAFEKMFKQQYPKLALYPIVTP